MDDEVGCVEGGERFGEVLAGVVRSEAADAEGCVVVDVVDKGSGLLYYSRFGGGEEGAETAATFIEEGCYIAVVVDGRGGNWAADICVDVVADRGGGGAA